MKIMSFNTQHCLNFISGKIDFEAVANAIKEYDPDFVGLNEMRGEGVSAEYTKQVDILSELTGMKYYYFAPAIYVPNNGLYGNGFLSKIPILKAENIAIPDPEHEPNARGYETRCILRVELEGGLTVLVSHFGLQPDEEENAVKTVIDNICENKCILMGDFNVTPENPVLNPIRAKMKDTADFFDEPKLSFPSGEPDRKIDYIFVSKDINVVSADIPPTVVSDHRPHTATIEV